MSKTEANAWETVSVTAISPGVEVLIKVRNGEHDGEEILLPAIAILHQTLFGEESITERIVLGILDVNTGEIMAASPDEVVAVDVPWCEDDDQDDANAGVSGFRLEQSD